MVALAPPLVRAGPNPGMGVTGWLCRARPLRVPVGAFGDGTRWLPGSETLRRSGCFDEWRRLPVFMERHIRIIMDAHMCCLMDRHIRITMDAYI